LRYCNHAAPASVQPGPGGSPTAGELKLVMYMFKNRALQTIQKNTDLYEER